jgi:hypothetical protein
MALSLILTGHLLATSVMVGIIWFVQLIHYPLFAEYVRSEWPRVSTRHQLLTSRLVFVPMLTEVVLSVLWVILDCHWLSLTALVLTGVTGFSTVLISVPIHQKLEAHWDDQLHRRLCRTNWIRTIAWTAHALLLTLASYL